MKRNEKIVVAYPVHIQGMTGVAYVEQFPITGTVILHYTDEQTEQAVCDDLDITKDDPFKVTGTVQRAARLLSNMSIHKVKGGVLMESHTIPELWELACKEDNIPTDSKFVEFSPDNYWAKQYDKAMTLYFKYRAGQIELLSRGG
jgi:hypothetical protein